ncbi:hypothetical protein [Paraburkholderia domus]|uniref:hypothetical protein n=1 Tax=Paraburkholderia domus TaxID=2793075 RepID=UPI0019137621|nr:hypothetical protein [Paraburkholderia domus]MBK5180456.1 hypothetical protein [Burkholderia sp. R-69749]CAE6801833.1 hypothetical protein R69749_02656 [Paraburkholderia domus]
MECKQTRLFMRRWLWYTIHDAFAQTFGWLTLFGTSFGGLILAKFGVPATNDPLTNNVIGACGGFVIGVGVYAIVGFFKTRRYMQPLVLSITDDVRSPDLTFNDQFRGYSVATIVKNRSDVYLKDCSAYVMNAPLYGGSTGPRFVEKFDLPPNSKKVVFVAYWFSRELPNPDDKDIGLTGPVGACFGGNVCRVPGPAILLIRIQPQDLDGKDVCCRVWIDESERRLSAAPMPD